ncbi:BspA family leucine-rich repeat surface protein [Flavobacteriaceae bacterium]|nr:BspA family leucine-rich repeat surface protein [Flavobacteriaceae bacterium]
MKKLLLLSLLVLFSCSKDSDVKNAIDEYEPLPQYTVSISAENGGTVSNAGGTFTTGYNFSVTATPNEGYAFDSWSDGVLDATRSFRVYDNTNLSASFFAIDTDDDGVADINDLCPNLNGSFEGVPNVNYAWENKTYYSSRRNVNESGCPLVSLHENGKTLIATEYASPGDYVYINSKPYLIVDNDLLNSLGEELSDHPAFENTNYKPLKVWFIITTFVDDLSSFNFNASTFSKDLGFVDSSARHNPDIRSWDVSNVTNMEGLFKDYGPLLFADTRFQNNGGFDISYWDVSNVTNMESLFENTRNQIYAINLENWNTSSVTNMKKMFKEFRGIFYNNDYDLGLSNWDVSSVTDMSQMFNQSYKLDQNLSNWDVSSVTDMSQMFYRTLYFTNGGVENGLSNWDVSSVTDMSQMFGANFYLEDTQDLSSWNVSNVTNCQGFVSPIINWGNRIPNFTNCSID